MRRTLRIAPAFLAVLLAAPAARGADTACAQCHEKLLRKKVVHAGAEPCDGCHAAVSQTHPQKGKKTFRLSAPEAELCANCHEAFGKKAFVHAPVKDGGCSTCHDAHSSDQPKLLSSPMKDLCGSCHADKVAYPLPHGPVSAGDCTACHTPHESAQKGLLLKAGDETCFGCHAEMKSVLGRKVVHAATQSGCTSCHDPHGAASPKLLAGTGGAPCFGCHAEIGERLKKAAVTHAPVSSPKACASCHDPHASDQPGLLPAGQKELCLGCHKGILDASMTTLHGPIAKGECVPCHDPHGSADPKLLVKSFPKAPYVAYEPTSFELCFSCHKRDLLAYPDTSFATNFRDGDRNLHYLHVNDKKKGRSCRLCHAMHGAANPLLVADKVPFGEWSLPLRFVKSENGGSCSPGCHRPLSYDRKAKKTEARNG